MKKIIFVIFLLSAVSISSCKKEAETAPSTKSLKLDGGPSSGTIKSDVGTWD